VDQVLSWIIKKSVKDLYPSNAEEEMSLDEVSPSSERTVQAANTGNSLNEPEVEEPGRTVTDPPQADNSINSTASVSVGIALVEDLFGFLEIEGGPVEQIMSPLSVIDRIKNWKWTMSQRGLEG
jgi:hypothetical protein